MPYCPKCDMEFTEGITACSNCKGPLEETAAADLREENRGGFCFLTDIAPAY